MSDLFCSTTSTTKPTTITTKMTKTHPGQILVPKGSPKASRNGPNLLLGSFWSLLAALWPALGTSCAALQSLLGLSRVSLGPSGAALGRSWAPLEGLLAALGALLTTFDAPSWRFLGPKMPSEAMLRPKYGFTKSIGKPKEKHTFLIPRWLQNAAR